MDERYQRFVELCEKKGVTAYKVAKETGITTATLSNWKNGRYMPKADKLQKIADFFGVSLEYLITGEDTGAEEIVIPADVVASEIAAIIHDNPVLIEMIYDFRDISEPWEKRLKGYYDALSNYERRKESI